MREGDLNLIFDIRHHIASLVAIFLALGIGIVIGTSMIGSEAITKQQEKIINSIEREFTVLREENKKNAEALIQAQEVMANQKKFNEAVLPVLVRGKLQDRRIAIVDLNYRKEHDGLVGVLRSAGADVRSVTVVNLALRRDQQLSRQVAAFLGRTEEVTPDKYLPDFARLFAAAILSGENEDFMRFLDDSGIIKVSGVYGPPLQEVILIGGSNDKELDYAKVFDLTMIEIWKDAGIDVYGVEDSNALISYMRYYQSARIATVDNIDTVFGQVALVQAMSGYPGQYGIKETADAFLPPLE